MAQTLQLELRTAAPATFTFDIDGEFEFRFEREHKDTAPEHKLLTRVFETWEITGARLVVGSAGTGDPITDAGVLWGKLTAFVALLRDRDSDPFTTARIIRDPAGSPVVERLLGASVFQGFEIQDLEITRNSIDLEAGSWVVDLEVNLTLLAEQVFSDADGIVNLTQTTRSETRRGCQRLEWVTEVETAEGTDAEPLARTYGRIPIEDFGDLYHYVTDSDTGVDIELFDADERNTADGSAVGGDTAGGRRIPTRVTATSIIQQVGIPVLGNAAGQGITEPFFEIRTEELENKTVVTTTARAAGSNRVSWVTSKAPSSFTTKTTVDDQTGKVYEIQWSNDTIGMDEVEYTAVITGGFKRKRFEPILNNFRPVLDIGPFTQYELTIEARTLKIGKDLTREQLPLIKKLGTEWVLDHDASSEDVVPRKIGFAPNPDRQRWERRATYVYYAGKTLSITSITDALTKTDTSVWDL